jgi:hypothetical protein
MDPLGRIDWKPGQRVSRRDSAELGVVTSVDDGVVKVKWDRGRTSYYRPGALGNVKLAEESRLSSCPKAGPPWGL